MSGQVADRLVEGSASGSRIMEVGDERGTIADQALSLIRRTFPARDRDPIEQIAMEIGEKRMGLLTSSDFHLFTLLDESARVVGVASGVYLGGVNQGFVTYLAVEEGFRERRAGTRLRNVLVDAFRHDAANFDWRGLAAVVGEVRLDNPWLRRLVSDRAVLPLDLRYYRPSQELDEAAARWVLYRQPVEDDRAELPTGEVRQLLYAIWRRAYRVRWPLEREGFHRMLNELEGRTHVGAHQALAV